MGPIILASRDMHKLKLNITQEDIDKSDCSSCFNVLSLAATRNGDKMTVFGEVAIVNGVACRLPEKVIKFLDDTQAGLEVHPVELEIEY